MQQDMIQAASAKWLIEQMKERGIPVDRLLHKTGLDNLWLKDEETQITPSQYCLIVLNALKDTGDDALGLTISEHANLNWYGFWGYAIISSATLYKATQVALKFWELNGALVKISLQQNQDYSCLDVSPAFIMPDERIRIFAIEEWLSTAYRALSQIIGYPLRLQQICLSYPEPAHADLYNEMFNCPIHFNTEKNQVQIASELLDKPLLMANPQVADFCISQCETMLYQFKQSDEFIHSIRKSIISSPRQLPKLDEIARQLGLSSRTLSRRLQERNTTYKQIVNEIRTELALEYLTNTRLTIDQIASLIGFAESSSFRRAFKKWTGNSAAAIRKAQI